MAVTKALRYSIFERDGHACRSCGATAPEVRLVVDHVTPRALGGTDQANNLRTLCQPCNSGKGATPPGAALVDEIKADALRHAAMIQAAYAVLVERLGLRNEYLEQVEAVYDKDLPADWANSVGRWFEMGVPVEIIVDAAEKACAKYFGHYRWQDRFKYFCGIVWNQVTAVDAVTTAKSTLEGAFHTAESLENFEIDAWKRGRESINARRATQNETSDERVYTLYEVDDIRQTSYNEGYSRSYQDTWNQVHERYPHLAGDEYAS